MLGFRVIFFLLSCIFKMRNYILHYESNTTRFFRQYEKDMHHFPKL